MQPVSTPEQALARTLAEEKFSVRAAYFDRKRKYCWKNVDLLAAHGLMGMTLPYDLGGKGASVYEVVLVAEELARHCALTARAFIEANMGAIGAIMTYGTQAQKALCAPLVLKGDKPALCLSEPEVGNTAEDMQTTARRVGNDYVLNGSKRGIVGGGISKIHLVFARILDEHGVEEGIGAFIVLCDPDKGNYPAGLIVEDHERSLGLCGMPKARLSFENVKVPVSMRLAPPSDPQHHFSDLMAICNTQTIGESAIAIGVAAGALNEATQTLRKRSQFGRPMVGFQGLQLMIADMDAAVHASRLLVHEAAKSAGPIGQRLPDENLAARANLLASEAALKVVNQALHIVGTRGYGNEETLERMYRDVRMFTTGHEVAEILRMHSVDNVLEMKRAQSKNAPQAAASQHFVDAAE